MAKDTHACAYSSLAAGWAAISCISCTGEEISFEPLAKLTVAS